MTPTSAHRSFARRAIRRRDRALAATAVLVLAAVGGGPGSVAADRATVMVDLPIPPKINTRAVRKVLVARFRSTDHPRIDPGAEMVQFLKREIGSGTPFHVLDVDPPYLPEQTIEELLANHVFWKHIADEHGADLVVSGAVDYRTRDRSGFVQEDLISPVTGQKIRRTRFAEQEEFSLNTSLWFFKGANGALLHKNSFRQKSVFQGKDADSLQVFFDLADTLSEDILGVLVPRKRKDPRVIFTR